MPFAIDAAFQVFLTIALPMVILSPGTHTDYFYLHMMLWVIILNPCEMNMLIAALTNYFYTNLSEKDFICLSIFLRELSKSMIGTTVFDGLCYKEKK